MTRRPFVPAVAAGLFVLLLTSCATIFQPGPDSVTISTQPPGASVSLDGAGVGTTPVTVTIDRTSGGMIRIELAGYQSHEFRLRTRVNGTVILNVFWGWLMPLGFLVDIATGNGSAWRSPNQIVLNPEVVDG
jgi:hypothetical protein